MRPQPMTAAERESVLSKIEETARRCKFPTHRDGSSVVVIERNPHRQWRVKTIGRGFVLVEVVVHDETDSTLTLTPIRFHERLLLARDADRRTAARTEAPRG